MTSGTVEFWLPNEGWGAITFDDGRRAFALFNEIAGVEGFRELSAGQRVNADVIALAKDEFAWVATGIRISP